MALQLPKSSLFKTIKKFSADLYFGGPKQLLPQLILGTKTNDQNK
jgi:hypothetical protein